MNAKANDGRTPLDFASGVIAELLRAHGGHSGSILNAARVGDLAGVQALLDAGVDMNAKDGNGWTALHYAADYGYEEIAELLIAKGADVNAKNPNMLTPLYFAAQNNRKEVAQLLIAGGADVNAKANDGRTLLDFASGVIAELLRAHGGHSGSILNAARVGDLAGVQALLDAGVDMNAKDGNGWTALHYAADYGYEEIAELLIAKGADVNAKNPNMLTPLYFAAQNNRKEVAQLLIAGGADVNAKANDGRTPLDFASGVIAELLRAHGGHSGSILNAARVGDLAGVQALLDAVSI